MQLPIVSVIVPVRNEGRFLEATLTALLHQHYPPDRLEVIVADGQSEDDTVEVVRRLQLEHRNLNLLSNPRRLSSAARNLGVRNSQGEYVLIVDGHCEITDPDYLRRLVEVFERWGVESVGRPQPLDVSDATPIQKAIALARASRLGHNPGSHIYSNDGGMVPPQSVAIAYRREVFDRIGYFDESFDACEDVEFNTRLHAVGGRCYLAPQLAIRYYPRASLGGLIYQMLRYGRGRARLLLKHPATFSAPPLVPSVFLLTLAATFALGLASQLFATLFCAIALVYGSALVVGASVVAARGRNPELAPLLPAVFMSIHVGAGWGVLAELAPGVARRILRRIIPATRALRSIFQVC